MTAPLLLVARSDLAPEGAHVIDATTLTGAREAVLAAARGDAVIALVDLDTPAAAQLHEDLRRIAPVELRREHPSGSALTDEQRRLLAHIAGGATLDEAARALHVSRRTASRRIAQARAALGVARTAEAAGLVRRGA